MSVRPSDIVLRRPPRWEGWIPTFSGRGFHPTAPQVEEVRVEDIVRGVAYKYRYGGHSNLPITVAEHSLLVADIIETLWPEAGQAKILAGLLHDTCESYTHDIQAPVRAAIKVVLPSGQTISWGDMERKVNQCIGRALGIDPDFYSAPEVRAADHLAAAIEQQACDNLRGQKWGLPAIPPEIAHLHIKPMSSVQAARRFERRMKALLTKVGSGG